MKTLTLLRHAKSGWDDPIARDFDRPLNLKGQRAATAIGAHLRSAGLRFDHVVASPARRVTDTLDHLARGYGERLAPAWDKRLYLASTGTLLDVIQGLPEAAGRTLLVGHNPGLEELVLMLVPDRDDDRLRAEAAAKYPTATIAELVVDDDFWGAFAHGEVRLTRFVRPRDLDATLGPDHD